MKAPALFCILAVIFAPQANAKYVQTSQAKYETRNGLSDWYTVDATFLTGTELNKNTNSFDYPSLDVFAVIFWSDHQASVIKLRDFYPCGNATTKSCLRSFGNLSGSDQQGREWIICTADICW